MRKKLLEFQHEMAKQGQADKMVTCPTYLLEVNAFHVNQKVIECCEKLFSVDDVLTSVEIWRHHYARGVVKIISETLHSFYKRMISLKILLHLTGMRSEMILPLSAC